MLITVALENLIYSFTYRTENNVLCIQKHFNEHNKNLKHFFSFSGIEMHVMYSQVAY